MNAVKDIYSKAALLPDNDLLIVSYEITPTNRGKIQLSNSVNLLSARQVKKLKIVLEFIEEYSIEYFIIPKHNTK
jgi:hypothetical protein